VILTEITKGKAVEVPAMGWVTKRTEIGVVRGDDDCPAPMCQHPMKLLHGAYDIRDVLNHMDGPNLAESTIADWVREVVQVGDDVGACT